MGGAQTWPTTSAPRVRLVTTVRPNSRPGAMRVMCGPTQLPSLSSDCEFKSDQSSASTSSLVLSMSERSGGSRHPHCGQQPHRKPGGHIKINLPVLNDEDTKDTITYQCGHWDLTVYCHSGCWDCTLLPSAIHSLQGYLGELVRS